MTTHTQSGYEFNDSENATLSDLARELTRLAGCLFALGVLLIGYLGVGYVAPPPAFELAGTAATAVLLIDYALWVIIGLLVVGEGAMLLRLVDPVRRITTTAGRDVEHLMSFMGRLTALVRVTTTGAVAVALLMGLSLGLALTVL